MNINTHHPNHNSPFLRLPTINGDFPSINTLPSSLGTFIRERERRFQENKIPVSTFWSEPIIPDNSSAFIQWLDYINYWIVSLREDEPSRAFYFLNKILNQSTRFPEVNKSAIFFRFLGEWIKSGTHAANYLPISLRLEHLNPALSYHINCLTRGKELFNNEGIPLNIEITEEMCREYRDKIPNVIMYLCEYYQHTGDYSQIQSLLRKGCRLSELLHLAQKKFDFITLEILLLLESEEQDNPELENLFELAGKKGLLELDAAYGEQWKKYTEQSITQLQVRRLLYHIKTASANDIVKIAKIITDRQLILDGNILNDEFSQQLNPTIQYQAKLNNEDRTILDRVEMLAYIWFKSLQKDTDKLLMIHNNFPKEFDILMDFQGRIINSRFSFETHISEPNARFFLGSFVDLFEFKVGSLHSSRPNLESLKEFLMSIYQIGMGKGEYYQSLQMFGQLPCYQRFERAAKIFFLYFDGSSPSNKEEVSRKIQELIDERERNARHSFDTKVDTLGKNWNTITRIDITSMLDGKKQKSKRILETSTGDEVQDQSNIIEIEFEKRIYRVEVFTKKIVLSQHELVELQDSLTGIMPYVHNLFIKDTVLNALKSAQHDMRTAYEISISGLDLVNNKVGDIHQKCSQILGDPSTPTDVILITQSIQSSAGIIGRLTGGIIDNLRKGSATFSKAQNGVEGAFSNSERKEYEKESHNIADFINRIYSGGFITKLVLHIEKDAGREFFVPIHSEDFFGVVTNIFQNAIRFKKDSQARGIINISFQKDATHLTINFLDSGLGIQNADIEACLGKGDFTTKKPHKDSQRVGFSSVREVITNHAGSIYIESNRSKVDGNLSTTEETYTKISIKLPLHI